LVAQLRDRRDQTVAAWAKAVAASLGGRASASELTTEFEPLFDAVLDGADSGRDSSGGDFDQARALLAEMSRSRAREGYSPTETAISIFSLKDAILAEVDTADAGALTSFLALSRVIDALGLFTFETYAEARNRIISEQGVELMELSTPVVKLWNGVVGVPLVGTLDSARTQVVTEKLLQALVDTGSEYAIIDITGVPAVDTQVAQHLLKTIVAARLMGAECIVSGIRPQIAQTIVALGIEFGDIVTKASLADALSLVISRSGGAPASRGVV
jgi:rsbT co-antagonist protein RsbR